VKFLNFDDSAEPCSALSFIQRLIYILFYFQGPNTEPQNPPPSRSILFPLNPRSLDETLNIDTTSNYGHPKRKFQGNACLGSDSQVIRVIRRGKATAVVINYFLSCHSCMAEIYRGISRSSVPVDCLLPQPDLY
jgi:hypothetical protein